MNIYLITSLVNGKLDYKLAKASNEVSARSLVIKHYETNGLKFDIINATQIEELEDENND